MSKRRPGTQLTHDNWDEEDESEEAGTFSEATKEVLQKREIKKARRKGANDNDQSNGESKPSVFKGFTGFAPTSATTAPSFNFKPTVTTTSNNTTPFGTAATNVSTNKQSTADQTSKYLHQLKSLNQSVTKWISEHVDKNPYCILTPIFNDYEKHLAELEKKYPDHSKEKPVTAKKNEDTKDKTQEKEDKKEEEKKDTTVTSPPTTFTFGAAASSNTTASNSATSSSLFSGFGNKPLGTSSSTTGIFGGFGSSKPDGTTPAATSGFTFAVSKTGSDASTSKGADGDGEEEEYVPPKNEVAAIKEDDAYYTKRCKLYYKKGESWADRGVGNLYLKKCEDKTVLLIRADTSLGNILLNILLSSAIPANRQGKNNVMISCVPNPPIDEKNKDDKTPVSMLLRVKTAEDADELFEKIKEAKES